MPVVSTVRFPGGCLNHHRSAPDDEEATSDGSCVGMVLADLVPIRNCHDSTKKLTGFVISCFSWQIRILLDPRRRALSCDFREKRAQLFRFRAGEHAEQLDRKSVV